MPETLGHHFQEYREAEPPREELSHRDVVDYVHKRQHDIGWEKAPAMLKEAEGWQNYRSIFPFFETEAVIQADAGSPRLDELRRLIHFMEERQRIQDDLPPTTIAAWMRERTMREYGRIVNDESSDREDRKRADKECERQIEAISVYEKYGSLPGMLGIVESAIAGLNHQLDEEVAKRPQYTKEDREHERRLKIYTDELEKIRRCRATLLETYFSNGAPN